MWFYDYSFRLFNYCIKRRFKGMLLRLNMSVTSLIQGNKHFYITINCFYLRCSRYYVSHYSFQYTLFNFWELNLLEQIRFRGFVKFRKIFRQLSENLGLLQKNRLSSFSNIPEGSVKFLQPFLVNAFDIICIYTSRLRLLGWFLRWI